MLLVFLLFFFPTLSFAGWNTGGSGSTLLTHATSCTGGAVLGALYQQCVDLDDFRLWTCVDPTSVGGSNATKCDVVGEWGLNSASAAAGVSTFNARAGAVAPTAGDYTATQTTNTPAGAIAAVNVQTALNELDAEKLATGGVAATATALAADGANAAAGNAILGVDASGAAQGAFDVGTQAELDAGLATKQATDADLTAIAALACTDGQIAKKAAGVWACAVDDNSGGGITGLTTGNLPVAASSSSLGDSGIAATKGTVNNLTVTGSATGAGVKLGVAGTDTNIGILMPLKGSHDLVLGVDHYPLIYSQSDQGNGPGLAIIGDNVTRYPGILLYGAGNANVSPITRYIRARGTPDNPTQVLTGDVLGGMDFWGWNDLGNSGIDRLGAYYTVTAAENFTNAASGSKFELFTTQIGSSSSALRMRIDGNGDFAFIGDQTITGGGVDASAASFFRIPNYASVATTLGGDVQFQTSDGTYKAGNGSATKVLAYTDSNITGTAVGLSATLGVTSGGTSVTTAPDDNLLVGNGTVFQLKALTDCDNATTSKMLYDVTTNAFSCGTDQTTGGAALTDPGANGVMTRTASTVTAPANATHMALPMQCMDMASTVTSAGVSPGATTVTLGVNPTTLGFAASGTAYLDTTDDFAYTGVSSTTFTGVTGVTGTHSSGVRVTMPTVGGVDDTYVCDLSPAITTYDTHTLYQVQAKTFNTGAATINLNQLGAKNIQKLVGGVATVLSDLDIQDETYMRLVYNGTVMILTNPNPSLQHAYDVSPASSAIVVGTNGLTVADLSTQAKGFRLCGDPACTIVQNTYYNGTAWVTEMAPIADYIFTIASTKSAIWEQADFDDIFKITEAGVVSVEPAGTVNFASAAGTAPHKIGTTPPGTCTVGQTFFDSDGAAGNNIFGCTATNTWTLQGDGGGGSLTDGDKGDITVGGGTTTLTIDADAVTDAKVVNTITASNYLPLAGGTLTGQVVTDNLGVEFEESDTNPTCAAGNYALYADTSEAKFKKCTNGVATDLDTSGGSFDGNVTGNFALSGDIAPAALTADTHDYAPTNLATSAVVKISSDKMVALTGLTQGADGVVKVLVNTGTFPILLLQESASSTAANRFSFRDTYLKPGESLPVIYGATNSRWLLFTPQPGLLPLDPTTRITVYEDWIGSAIAGLYGWVTSGVYGTGGSIQMSTAYGINATSRVFGGVQIDTGTTAVGGGQLNLGGSGTGQIIPALGQMTLAWRIAVEALSTSAEEFVVICGAHDTAGSNATNATDGIYFRYDRATDGDFWSAATAAASTRTITVTAQPVTTGAIWLMAITNAAWSSVSYFARAEGQANWSYLGAITTNIPSGAQLFWPSCKMDKSVGTTQRNLTVDAFFMQYEAKR